MLWRFSAGIQTQITEKPVLKTFTPPQNAIVWSIRYVLAWIIPATRYAPGAKVARVSAFIDLILKRLVGRCRQEDFLDGLVDVDQRSQGIARSENFVESTVAQQTEVMRAG